MMSKAYLRMVMFSGYRSRISMIRSAFCGGPVAAFSTCFSHTQTREIMGQNALIWSTARHGLVSRNTVVRI